jgi:RNA polymerase subunit RPABC4/transcription elongation factor Spt4
MSTSDEIKYEHHAKKCPECMTYIPVDANVCPVCKKRVGKTTESGMARKATDWKSYIMLIVSWAALAVYIWWAFLKE